MSALLHENIKKARKEKGLSQEELALKLHVVRQTVSKWENGLSVPDADVLIKIADILETPVSRLLDREPPEDTVRDLSEELARVNEALAARNQELKRHALAGRKRGLLLFLSFLTMIIAMTGKNGAVSLLLIAGCALAALLVLYRNLALLTETADRKKLDTLRGATVFSALLFGTVAGVVLLDSAGIIRLSGEGERLFVMLIVCAAMLGFGYLAPRLPFNRHTGLRLPWTVRDEETWNLAHRLLGLLSLPLTLLFIAASFVFHDLGAVVAAALLAWVGLPGLLSGIFFWKKFHG